MKANERAEKLLLPNHPGLLTVAGTQVYLIASLVKVHTTRAPNLASESVFDQRRGASAGLLQTK